MKLTKIAIAALGAVSMFAAGTAGAVVFPDFQVNPGAYSSAKTFTADKMVGGYSEVVTFTSPTTFDISLKWEAGSFFKNDGVTLVTKTGLGNDYGIYALFKGTGTVSTSGVTTTFNLASGALSMYVDKSVDTEFTEPVVGSGGFAASGATGTDDVLIATGVVKSGQGKLDPTKSGCNNGGIDCGSFGQTTTFVLENPAGTSFFVSPTPFYDISFQSGQLNNFDVANTQRINGSLDVVFTKVPEPASLALVGLALVGMGAARRRKA